MMTCLPRQMIQALMQKSNSPQDDFLLFDQGKFYLSCLVTLVGKHPGAVLLLNAQRSILLTFNEFYPPLPRFPRPHGAAMPDPFASLCSSEHVGSHLRTTHAEITGISAPCFRYATAPAYVRGEIGRAAPQDPSTAALLSSNVFVPTSTTGLLWLSSCLVHVTQYEHHRQVEAKGLLNHANNKITFPQVPSQEANVVSVHLKFIPK